jgi:hypothetical protein
LPHRAGVGCLKLMCTMNAHFVQRKRRCSTVFVTCLQGH